MAWPSRLCALTLFRQLAEISLVEPFGAVQAAYAAGFVGFTEVAPWNVGWRGPVLRPARGLFDEQKYVPEFR